MRQRYEDMTRSTRYDDPSLANERCEMVGETVSIAWAYHKVPLDLFTVHDHKGMFLLTAMPRMQLRAPDRIEDVDADWIDAARWALRCLDTFCEISLRLVVYSHTLGEVIYDSGDLMLGVDDKFPHEIEMDEEDLPEKPH